MFVVVLPPHCWPVRIVRTYVYIIFVRYPRVRPVVEFHVAQRPALPAPVVATLPASAATFVLALWICGVLLSALAHS